MKVVKWKSFALWAVIVLFKISVLSAFSDCPVENNKILDEMVVSTSRSEISVSNVPQSVSVITKEEIMASPFERVEDILRSVAGVYNTRHYGAQTSGVSNPITVRGVGGNRVLFLVDGVPQNDNFNNAIAWVAWGHIPKDSIERIEVVRGPASAVYGSEGIGGVVHIITKTPEPEREIVLRGEVGTADTYAGHGLYSQKKDRFGVLIAGGYEESDGFYMTEDVESYNTKRHREAGKILGKLSCDVTDNSILSLSALYYDHETGKGREFFYDTLTLDQYSLNYTLKSEKMMLKTLVYYNHADKTAYQDRTKDNYASLYRKEEVPATVWGADIQATVPVRKTILITVGSAFKEASWDYDDIYVSSDRDEGAEGRQYFISPFVNIDLNMANDRLIINMGGRYDWIETVDGANWDSAPDGGADPYSNNYKSKEESDFSPKMGLVFHADNRTTFRTSVGKGFRAPSLYELYKVHVRGGGTSFRHANPDLRSEKIWSYDIGAERLFGNSLWARFTFYQSFADDYIGNRVTNTYEKNGKTYTEYVLDNISKVDIYGVESEFHWHVRSDLSLFGNYTFNVSKIDEDKVNTYQEGLYLTNDPKHKIHVGTVYQNPQIANITLLWNYYIDKYYSIDETTQGKDTFWSMDLGVSRKFWADMSAYLNIENIFDSVDNESIAPGTIYTGGIKLQF